VRRRSVGRRRAEDILDGRADPNDPVGRVIAAAQNPPQADEIAGLDVAAAALTASTAASTSAAPAGEQLSAPTAHGATLTTLVAGTTARKIIAAAAVAAVAGATAVAITVGGRSSPAPGPSTTTGHTSPVSSSAPHSNPSKSAASTAQASTSGSSSGAGNGARDRALRDLCRTWLSASADVRAHNPKFRILIKAAGATKVDPYCAGLLKIEPGSRITRPTLPTSVAPSTSRVRLTTPRVRVSTPSVPLNPPTAP
jgi:hypothetical protein